VAELVKIHNNHTGYFDVLAALFRSGRVQDSRNGKTLEVEDLVIEVENPTLNSPEGVRPNYNSSIGVVEGLQLLAGISDSGLTADIQPQFRAYMDDGKFWGAYGPRTVDQFPIIVNRLIADHDTRQAVITLWDPEFDALGGKKDHPCTTAFFFLIRDGKLNMKVVMRSMDLWWGWPYDAVQFSMVHQAVAACVGAAVGTYTHHAISGHLYEPHWDIANDTLKELKVTETAQPVLSFAPTDSDFINVYEGERGAAPGPILWRSIQRQAFDTLGVVSGIHGPDKLINQTQQALAQQLLERKSKVVQQNLEKIKALDVW
jgi:thymidylate synthase